MNFNLPVVRGGKDTGCSSALPATVTCEEGNVFVNTTQWCNGDFAEFTNGIFILGIVISMSALAEQGADHGSSDIDSGSMDFVSCNIRPPRDEDGDHVVRLSEVFCWMPTMDRQLTALALTAHPSRYTFSLPQTIPLDVLRRLESQQTSWKAQNDVKLNAGHATLAAQLPQAGQDLGVVSFFSFSPWVPVKVLGEILRL